MLLGFIVSKRGIEVDLSKVRAILEMPPPKNLKELARSHWQTEIHSLVHL